MREVSLPVGNYGSLLSYEGWTYFAYSLVQGGMQMLRWPDGNPTQWAPLWNDGSSINVAFAKLGMASGRPQVLYRYDAPDGAYLTGREAETGTPAWSSIPCEGNNPIAWGPNGLLGAQLYHRQGLYHWGQWPGPPSHYVEPGYPDGLASVTITGAPIFAKDVRGSIPGMLNPRVYDGLTVGEHVDGGVATLMVVDGVERRGWLKPLQETGAPCACRQSNGLWSVGYHVAGPHGTVDYVILADMTTEEVLTPFEVPLPPVSVIPQLNRPFAFGCFTFNTAASLGDLGLNIRPPLNAPYPFEAILAAGDYKVHQQFGTFPWFDRVEDAYLVAALSNPHYPLRQALEDAAPIAEQFEACRLLYQDAFPLSEDAISLAAFGDVTSCVFQLGAAEGLDAFYARCVAEYARVSSRRPFWGVLNLVGDGKRALNALITLAHAAQDRHWAGLLVFGLGRVDVDEALLAPYLVEFNRGITALPPKPKPSPKPPDPPDPIPVPDPEDEMRSAVFVDEKWQTVLEESHQDAGPEHGPLVGVRRKGDGFLLKVRGDGKTILFEPGDRPGADERLIPTPGGYYAERPGGNVLIKRAGPWNQ